MTAWAKGSRRDRLPPDWPQRRQVVKARAKGQCQAEHHAEGCTGQGTQCDHVIPNDDHAYANLQWLSKACHDAKTELERQAGYARSTRTPHVEPPPGLATSRGAPNARLRKGQKRT
jgi:5-methylcytosine-specific restriction protein A